MRDAVRNVAKYFPTAIISGRNRDKVALALVLYFAFYCSKLISSCPVVLYMVVISLIKQGAYVSGL